MDFDFASEQIREVFARFGLALYQAQCLEKQIVMLLSGPYSPTPEKLTKGRIDDLMETGLDQTFGALVKELKRRTKLPIDIDDKLERSVKKRNWLSHHYWWDRASEFNTFAGRAKMIAELIDLAELFDELDGYFVKIEEEWLIGRGLTKEAFDAFLIELLSGPTPPRKIGRKLGKVETLIKVYFYVADEDRKTGAPLFELADHTIWSLCDCGLTYGPEEIDFSRLKPDPMFEEVLPAKINPRPRGAKDWNYKISLSTGFYVQVSPYDGGEYEFKYGLFRSR